MWPYPQFPADLVTFTKEILNRILHFLDSETQAILKLKICCWRFEVFFTGIFRESIIMEKACLKLTAELIIFSLQNKNLENIKKVILMDIIIYTEWWMRKNSICYSNAWQLRSDMQWHFWQITTKAPETHQLILN